MAKNYNSSENCHNEADKHTSNRNASRNTSNKNAYGKNASDRNVTDTNLYHLMFIASCKYNFIHLISSPVCPTDVRPLAALVLRTGKNMSLTFRYKSYGYDRLSVRNSVLHLHKM